ncbi:unnamed protein product [Chondrus crispus]|uniref:Uncharacterized protein n=1 Tax=Chondrus crispus TaxID=2769 RepID=R7QHL3_CHOCR|nr:unnamed protein product [Chondrus crispus]CDF37554.1 unnamed protein product [Chondrus crispus]|eukprot:XP_005717425.1 unnamed protein product [Chondrus crispus]
MHPRNQSLTHPNSPQLSGLTRDARFCFHLCFHPSLQFFYHLALSR